MMFANITRRASRRKNGVDAARQEAFYADRHFSNAFKFQSLKLCDPFEAILSYFDDTRN